MILPHAANLDQSNFRERQAYLSAAFSAPAWLFDLRSEPTRFKRRNISATIVAGLQIKTVRVFGTHRPSARCLRAHEQRPIRCRCRALFIARPLSWSYLARKTRPWRWLSRLVKYISVPSHLRAPRWMPQYPMAMVTRPVWDSPIARAAAGDRSRCLPRTHGPRSFIRTVTHPL